MIVPRSLSISTFAVALLGTGLASRAIAADGNCVLRPLEDVQAIRTVLVKWAASAELPSFEQGKWDVSVDHSSVRVKLDFAKGAVTVGWALDVHCKPITVTIETSADYEGKRPDEAAAQQLAASFSNYAADPNAEKNRPVEREWLRQVFANCATPWLGGLMALVGFVMIWRWRGRARRTAARSAPSRISVRARAGLRAFVANLPIMLTALAVALGIVEIAVRRQRSDERVMTSVLMQQQSNREVHQASDDWFLHYELRPGAHLEQIGYWGNRYHMNIDQFGSRAPTHPEVKGKGVFRILCFGGSTTYGADVSDEETISASMERRLNDEVAHSNGTGPVRHFEAWNFGLHAYVLSQAAHRARRELAARDPDLILVQLHNSGARPFFLETGEDQIDLLKRFASDTYLLPENFPPPAFVPSVVHFWILRHSATYRLIIGFLRRLDHSDIKFAEQLSRDEALALSRDATARGVPVLFYSIPCDGDGPKAAGVYPDLPEERFINFYEPGHEPNYYMMHPPARFLDEYAGQLITVLRQRGYIPAP